MKKLILPLLVAGAFAAPSMAQAASHPYVSLSSGLSLLNNASATTLGVTINDAVKYKTGYLVNGAIGLKQGDARFEAEIGYHHNGVDSTVWLGTVSGYSASAWTFMANAYYDFDIHASSITPFVMGGLGLAELESTEPLVSYSSTQFAWQLGAGVGIKASKDVTVDLGYRYLNPSDPTFAGTKYSVGGSELLVGIRYNF
jgi:opacity protein-like surface antigen